MKNEVTLMSPDNSKISASYQEIGIVCRKLCEEYCQKSRQNENQFSLFCQQYSFFSPYFDFVLSHLNYLFLNPLLEADLVWQYENGQIRRKEIPGLNQLTYHEIKNYHSIPYYYPLMDQNSLKVHSIEYDQPINSIITDQGFQIDVCLEKNQHHDDVFERILNEMLLSGYSSSELYRREFPNYPTVNAYFRQKFGYMQIATLSEEEGFLIYDETFDFPWMSRYKDSILSRYPNYHFISDVRCKKIS